MAAVLWYSRCQVPNRGILCLNQVRVGMALALVVHLEPVTGSNRPSRFLVCPDVTALSPKALYAAWLGNWHLGSSIPLA